MSEVTEEATQDEERDRRFRIVVGVDGSPNGQEAFEWALSEARLRRTGLRAVLAWRTPYDWQVEPMFPVDVEQVRASAQHQLDVALARVDAGEVDVQAELVEGEPGAVLVAASREADLLVVGARGHNPLVELIIGSVGTFCAHHAACPVVLVPPATRKT